MMNDTAALTDILLTVGLLAVPIAALVWFARGADPVVIDPFGMRFDASYPTVPEEIDPPRWRVELIGRRTSTSEASELARPRGVERADARNIRIPIDGAQIGLPPRRIA